MQRPNILLITSDQQHYDTIGCVNSRIRTPAFDRCCREGIRFERAYCSNPVCSPSRSSIITGQYPAWHHCWTIGVKLPEDVPTVGEIFQQNGYASTLIGKAHFQPLKDTAQHRSIESQPTIRNLDFWREFHGPWYGFNHVETARMHSDEHHVGQHYAIWLEEKGLHNWRDYFMPLPGEGNALEKRLNYTRDNTFSWTLPEELHHTRWVGERTIANIERCAGNNQPFFLWSSFFDPHPPYLVSEPWASMYNPEEMDPGTFVEGEFDNMPPHFALTQKEQPDFSSYKEPGGQALHGFNSHRRTREQIQKEMAAYYGMTSFIDHEVGRIFECLDRLGIAEQTLVVFSTDHGHFLGQHGLCAKGPFHYEDMIRIPMLARWPGVIPAGTVSRAIQNQVDYAPTFLSACGIDVPGQMQGINQLACWRGETEGGRDHAIIENRHNPTSVHLRTLVEQRYKITVYREGGAGELFDLESDPRECNNLWDVPEAQTLKSRLLLQFVQAEIRREPTRMPRVAHA